MKNLIGVFLVAIGFKIISLGMELVTDKAIQKNLLEGVREGFGLK